MGIRELTGIKKQVLWMAGSGLVALMTFCGLLTLAPLNYHPGQNEFLLSLFLFIVLWSSLVTCFFSFLCWIASVAFKSSRDNHN
jgi:hypothetical protein